MHVLAFTSQSLLALKLDAHECIRLDAKRLLLFQIKCFAACVEALLLAHCTVHHLLVLLATLVALHVLVLAELGVIMVELLIAALKQVVFWVKQRRVAVTVDVAVKVAHAIKHVGRALHTVLTVENQDGALL